ncbi:MAG TPA: chromosomal replication initiator protein DnaA, partial [Candidatus Polarisedimenticolia bacterium]|nr:chromosomal replication initiator protein DnaA [Candidatus Polarisedimenticolia bacterium]
MTLWDRILDSLQNKMNAQSFNTWLRPTHQLSFGDGMLQVEVPSSLFVEWIDRNYRPLIQESARECDAPGLTVHFTSRDLPPAPPPAPRAATLARDGIMNRVLGTRRHAASADGHPEVRPFQTMSDGPPATVPARPLALAVAPVPMASLPGSGLTPRYTFDTFVVSSCNQFAHAAAMAVADQPSGAYNPLFIYGGVGLGKTHLMHAVGNRIVRSLPGLRMLYISAETFMTELINSIRYEKTIDFKERYRGVDVLLIDDIQFLAGKERTQEEFFHTFNALYESQKQIIITSDCPPRDIPTLEERLRSRFEWGLIADIQPPDLETKVAILRKKSEAEHINLPEDVSLFIASRVRSNIRELEGSLIRLVAFAALSGRAIDLDMARETLRDLIDDRGRGVGVEAIQKAIAAHYGIKLTELKSRNNSKHIAFPRQVAMYVCKQLTDKSLPALGDLFGGKHHTTVIHAIRKIEGMRSKDRDFD